MPGGAADTGTADAFTGGREFEHYIDGSLACVGMIVGEDIDRVGPGGRASDIIALAPFAGFSVAATSPATMIAASSVSSGSSSECW